MIILLFVKATIGFSENLFLVVAEYSSVCVCVCVFVILHHNSKSNQSRNTKFKHIVAYENISDKFDNGHCRIKVKVTARL